MATKYGPRKKHNAGTIRSSTTTRGGSRTRKTVTVKTGNYTRSRSVNKNGTVRQTTTHKSPSGFWTRTTKTIGSKPSKPKAPKFVKVKSFKVPKIRLLSAPKVRVSKGSSSRSRRSGGSSGNYTYDESEGFFTTLLLMPFRIVGWFIEMIFTFIFWCIKWGLILTAIYFIGKLILYLIA